jgi:hypothetical protein
MNKIDLSTFPDFPTTIKTCFLFEHKSLIEEAIQLIPEKVFWTWIYIPIITITNSCVNGCFDLEVSHDTNCDIAMDLVITFIDGYLAGKGIVE